MDYAVPADGENLAKHYGIKHRCGHRVGFCDSEIFSFLVQTGVQLRKS